MLVTIAGGESPVAADTEVGDDVEKVEETGAWVVSDEDVTGSDVAINVVAVVATRLEVEVVDGEDVDVVDDIAVVLVVVVEVEVVVVVVEDVEDVVMAVEVVSLNVVDVEDEDVEDEDVEDEDVEVATTVEDVEGVELMVDEVEAVLVEVGAEVAVDEVDSEITADEVVTTGPQPPAGAGILSSACPEWPCLVASSSTSMRTNLLSPVE
ncbi:MAG: hypothetical protein ACKO73_00090 [Acidimicrobiaceae bacterium]